MIRTSKRAVLVRPHEPIEVWDNKIPDPEPGSVVARVEMCGVCGSDVHLWRGDFKFPNPIALGHEAVATIEELGPGVTTDCAGVPVKAGDRIYWSPVRQCFRCYYCTVEKDFSSCVNLFEDSYKHASEPPVMAYAERCYLPPRMAFYRVPDDTPTPAVIAFGCAMPTVLQGLERLGGIKLNQSVVVQGCGPVGLAATMMARIAGARKVIVIGAPARRLEMARRLGADATIDMQTCKTEAERVAQVRDLTDGRGADVVIEAAGHISAFPEGLKLVAKNGRYVIIGLWSAPGTVPVEPRYINNNNIQIIGNALAQPQHLYGAIQVARTHHREYPMMDVITDKFSLADTQKALEAVEQLKTIKSVIVPNLAAA